LYLGGVERAFSLAREIRQLFVLRSPAALFAQKMERDLAPMRPPAMLEQMETEISGGINLRQSLSVERHNRRSRKNSMAAEALPAPEGMVTTNYKYENEH
jgi:hypothetical protein